MEMSDRRRRKLEGCRRRILEGAGFLFREYGYESVTMQDVADTAEVSKGSLYLQFRNKGDLVLALAIGSLDGLREAMEAEAARPGSARERLERLARAYMAYVTENHDARDYLHRAAGLRAHSGSERQSALREKIDGLYGIVATIFDEGSRDGSVRPEVEAVSLARLFAAGMGAFAEEEPLGRGFIELFMYFISPEPLRTALFPRELSIRR